MIWKSIEYASSNTNCRTGLRIRASTGVNDELKKEVRLYAKWLRQRFSFPIRVPVYLKKQALLTAADGDHASAIFFEPDDHNVEPYIKIAAGSASEDGPLENERIVRVLFDLTHELTHYYQWLNNANMSNRGRERQATNYGRRILWEYMMWQYPGLYAQLTQCVPYCSDAYCQIKPLEKDRFGRILFESRIVTDECDIKDLAVVSICQLINGNKAFYYPDISYKLFSKSKGLEMQEILDLKVINSWNQPSDISKCVCAEF